MNFISLNVPLILTLTRLIVSPLLLPILIVSIVPYHNAMLNGMLACFFVLINLTDFFDGYLARRYHQETRLGKLLDPIADKFLLFSVVLALVSLGLIYFFWAIILIGREFFVMGLRIIGFDFGIQVHVQQLGKLKTVVLMIYITSVIVNATHTVFQPYLSYIEGASLAWSLLLSLISAYNYFQVFRKNIGVRMQA